MNRRRGFTTVELMVVLVIGGVIAAAIGSVLRRQQRFFTNAATLVQRRGSLRDATAILPAEVRALAPPDGDIIAFSDSALEMHATIGAAVACDTVAGGVALDLSPVRSARPVPLAAYSTMPQAGDAARVFDGGATNAADDDVRLPQRQRRHPPQHPSRPAPGAAPARPASTPAVSWPAAAE